MTTSERSWPEAVERVVSVRLPTDYGEFEAVAYRETLTGKQHVALVKGDVAGAEDVLVRVHSECLTGDVFHSRRCDCGEQLERARATLSLVRNAPWTPAGAMASRSSLADCRHARRQTGDNIALLRLRAPLVLPPPLHGATFAISA